MERRELLRRAGVALGGTVPFAGCTADRLQESEREPPLVDGIGEEEIDLPVSQPLGVAEAGIERGSETEIDGLDDFEAYLADSGLEVEHLEETTEAGEHLLTLEYVAEAVWDLGLTHHLGIVAGGYAALVEGGHGTEKLEAYLLDSDSREFGEYEIRRHWAEEYNDDERSARGYADGIAVTVETT